MPTYNYNDLAQGEKDSARNTERMVKVATVAYTMTGSESATETLRLFKAPKNAVVKGYHIQSSGVATTATLDIGVEDGAVDSIADGVDVAAAGVDQVWTVANVAIGGKDVYATLATLATPTADGVLTVSVFYDYTT